jgi:hypothetical protein
MSAIEEEVLIGTAMVAGRVSDGDVRKTALEKVAVLKPELPRNQQQQAWRTASTHVRQEGHLKQTQVKSQATTSARSACTAEQQWRWHQLIDHLDNQHCRINPSDGTGLDFKEVESAFKVNGAAQRRRRASKNRMCLVSSGLATSNDEAFGTAEPTRRMPSRGASRKKARASIDYGI